jgi:hypothetical protein
MHVGDGYVGPDVTGTTTQAHLRCAGRSKQLNTGGRPAMREAVVARTRILDRGGAPNGSKKQRASGCLRVWPSMSWRLGP